MAVKARGRVTRLYVHEDRVNIRLEGPPAERPLDGYFVLMNAHPNYNALYSLALSAAVNGYVLQIRTADEIVPDQAATVKYMVVDW